MNNTPNPSQSSHYAVNHEHTRYEILYCIAARRRNQIKEKIIRMEQKQKTEKEGTGGAKPKTLWGSFIHVWTSRITGFSPLIREHPSTRKMGFLHLHSLRLEDCLSFRLGFFPAEGSLQDFRVIQSSTSTQLRLMPSTVRINCLALSWAAQQSQIPRHHGGWVKMFSSTRKNFLINKRRKERRRENQSLCHIEANDLSGHLQCVTQIMILDAGAIT